MEYEWYHTFKNFIVHTGRCCIKLVLTKICNFYMKVCHNIIYVQKIKLIP